MKTILYATDFSDHAEKALIYAGKLAQAFQARLLLLHVFDIPTSWQHPHTEDPVEMEKESVRSAENKLRRLWEQQAGEKTPEAEVRFMAVENASPVKGITAVIREEKPALVVVGTKGASRIRETILGSTTKALINRSPRPVLAIPENAPAWGMERVLYASDFEKADIPAIRQLIELLRPFEPEIRIVHVSSPEEYRGDEKFDWFEELVKEKVDYEKLSFERLVSDDVYERLNEYVRKNNIDVIAMLERERPGLAGRLLHVDLVKKMEFHTSVPLLSFNAHYLKVFSEEKV